MTLGHAGLETKMETMARGRAGIPGVVPRADELIAVTRPISAPFSSHGNRFPASALRLSDTDPVAVFRACPLCGVRILSCPHPRSHTSCAA
jgi:hypothetical protein